MCIFVYDIHVLNCPTVLMREKIDEDLSNSWTMDSLIANVTNIVMRNSFIKINNFDVESYTVPPKGHF